MAAVTNTYKYSILQDCREIVNYEFWDAIRRGLGKLTAMYRLGTLNEITHQLIWLLVGDYIPIPCFYINSELHHGKCYYEE